MAIKLDKSIFQTNIRERKIIKVDAGYAVVDYKKYRVE